MPQNCSRLKNDFDGEILPDPKGVHRLQVVLRPIVLEDKG